MFTSTIDVRFYELDPYGHVNHGVYLNYFEVARAEMLASMGFSLPDLLERGVHIVVIEVAVRFKAPARAGDRLTVHTAPTEIRAASSRWHQRLLRGEELVATNDVRSALTDVTGRPIRVPEDFAAALRALAIDDR
jgi:acyl-CoA thioester hydrolase